MSEAFTKLPARRRAATRRPGARNRLARSATVTAVLAAMLVAGSGCGGIRKRLSMLEQVADCRRQCQDGRAAIDQGDWPTAVERLKQAVAADGGDVPSRRWYAEALWSTGKFEPAIAEIHQALELAPDDTEILMRAASMEAAVGNLPVAIEYAERALDLNPKSAEAWIVRARIRRQAGQRHEALLVYERPPPVSPPHRRATVEPAELYGELGRPERALVSLQAVRAQSPPGEEPLDVLARLARTYTMLERHEDAAACYRTAIDQHGSNPDLLALLGEAKLRTGKTDEAQALANQALALDPGHSGGRVLFAKCQEAVAQARPYVPLNR